MSFDPIDRRLLFAGIGMAGIAAISRTAGAGPIDPPAGPITSTGKTLQSLYERIARGDAGLAEPRTAVQSLSGTPTCLHLIDQPGSYYLTGNLGGASGKSTIEIVAPDVTLDLSGFTINADAAVLPSFAIRFAPSNADTSLRVINGTISGSLQLDPSVLAAQCLSVLEDVRIRGVVFADHVVLRRCEVRANSSGAAVIVRGDARIEFSKCTSQVGADVSGGLVAADSEFSGMTGLISRGSSFIRYCRINGFNAPSLSLSGSGGVIERNTLRAFGTAAGLLVTGTGNLITNNSVAGGSPPYSIGAGNSYGPVVSVAGAGDLGSIPAASHPYANFVY
jgi:hypothetical protein